MIALETALSEVDRARSVAFRVLRNQADVDDALQNARIHVWKALAGFKEKSALRTWIHRIVHNDAIMLLRKRRVFVDIDTIEIESARPGPEKLARNSQLRKVLGKAISELPPMQKKGALRTFLQEECPTKDTMEKGRRYKAMQKLRAALEPYRERYESAF